MSIMQYNGGSVVAMVGKDCVAIAADKRLGAQFMTVSTNFQRSFKQRKKHLLVCQDWLPMCLHLTKSSLEYILFTMFLDM
ncbi:unnamed protein product [Rhizopus stolonifer]